MVVEDSLILEQFGKSESRDHAFKLLLNKYQQKVYWHIRRIVINHDDADDLVQDVFIKIWKNLSNFRQDSQLYTWIYRIATNESITFLNKKSQKHNISFEELSEKLGDSLNDDNYFTGDEIQKKLQ